MDAWLGRMQQNHGIIPSFVDLDGSVGGPQDRWWNNAYGWGFSPVNPVTGKREHRNRIPRALVGFSNALLVTGDQKYVDAWRTMIDAVNANARVTDGRKEYPTMYGADGWYGWQAEPWRVGALEVWYWSMRDDDRARDRRRSAGSRSSTARTTPTPRRRWSATWKRCRERVAAMRARQDAGGQAPRRQHARLQPRGDRTLVRLMFGAIPPGREGGLLNARLRYFDPVRKRAGVPPDVAALVSALGDTRTVVTLVNLSPSEPRTVIVQGGAYGEHQMVTVTVDGRTTPIDAPLLTVQLGPGCGQQLVLEMKRYANVPTVKHPWHRGPH